MPSGWSTNGSSPYNTDCGYNTILLNYGSGETDPVIQYSTSSLGTNHYALKIVFTVFYFD